MLTLKTFESPMEKKKEKRKKTEKKADDIYYNGQHFAGMSEMISKNQSSAG